MKFSYKDIDFAFNKRIYIFSIYVIFSKDQTMQWDLS